MKNWFRFIFMLPLLTSCVGNPSKDSAGVPEKILAIEIPSPPTLVTFDSDYDMAVYMAEHFWDNFDFTDTAYVDKPEVTEEAFGQYALLLNSLPPDAGRGPVSGVMNRARADSSMYAYFAGLFEKYFYDPNSPVKNEELYIPVLENIVSWDGADELVKLRPRSRLDMALKNRVGQKATDFEYTTPAGRPGRLYDINADYVMLYFFDPECGTCKEVTYGLTTSPLIGSLVNAGTLEVAAIYTEKNVDFWRQYTAGMPKKWINGYDRNQSINNDRLYDLKAMPTIYLLDRDKTVLIKDAPTGYQIELYLSEIGAVK